VTVPPEAAGVEGSSVYLKAGEKIKLEDLLYALMLSSANDAAAAIAISVSGSIDAFAELMNAKARELGLENTHFENPHGLDVEEHYTTAYELAKIAAYALENEMFAKIVSTVKHIVPASEGGYARALVNHNRLLREYDDIIGVKTGFTKKCGRTLVSAARRGGVTLVCVTLCDGDDWRDHRAILDYGFSEQSALQFLRLDKISRLYAAEYCHKSGYDAAGVSEYVDTLVSTSSGKRGRAAANADDKDENKHRNIKFSVGDIRFLFTSIENAVRLAKKAGFTVTDEKDEDDNGYNIHIRVDKNKN
jgi:D-alanyl-D-alanine carboxypeptidase